MFDFVINWITNHPLETIVGIWLVSWNVDSYSKYRDLATRYNAMHHRIDELENAGTHVDGHYWNEI